MEKYYVIAFGIDWCRFPIYSKHCDAELIKWPETPDGVEPKILKHLEPKPDKWDPAEFD